MTYERRVVTRRDDDPATVPGTSTNQVVERTQVTPSGGEMIRRVVVLIFGIIQVFIGLRIVLLLLNAREGNDLVAFILNVSQVFVTPSSEWMRSIRPAQSSTSRRSPRSSAGRSSKRSSCGP